MKLIIVISCLLLTEIQLSPIRSHPIDNNHGSSYGSNDNLTEKPHLLPRDFIDQLRNSANSDDLLSEVEINELTSASSIKSTDCDTAKIREFNQLREKHANRAWLEPYFKSLTSDLGWKCHFKFVSMLFTAEQNIRSSNRHWEYRTESFAQEVAGIEGSWSSGELDDSKALEILQRASIPHDLFVAAAKSLLTRRGMIRREDSDEAAWYVMEIYLSGEFEIMLNFCAESISLFNELRAADPASFLDYDDKSKVWISNFLVYNTIRDTPIASLVRSSKDAQGPDSNQRLKSQWRKGLSNFMKGCIGGSCSEH